MRRFRVLSLFAVLLFASAANATAWSSRWMVNFKSAKSDGSMVITSTLSPNQISGKIKQGSNIGFFTTQTSFYTGAVVGGDIQVDIQPQTGAVANALGSRFGWVVVEARSGTSSAGTTYYIKLANDPLDANVSPSAYVELFFTDATQFALFAPSGLTGTKLYLDFGTCLGTCLTTL